MKIVLIGSFPTCNLLYQSLLQHCELQGVCTEKSKFHTSSSYNQESFKKQGISTFIIDRTNITTDFKIWLEDKKPDVVLVCGFSLKVPQNILSIPTIGFLNIHFGKLPENRGPDPLFWSIKNGDTETAITIHKMDADWDTGPIFIEYPVPIITGETLGMLNSKMSYFLKDISTTIIEHLKDSTKPRPQSKVTKITYLKRPTVEQLTINWDTQTADEIENLVNACNPKYGGATTYYQRTPIKIIEVSPVDSQTPLFGRTPGEIIHAHPQEGLFVCCKYGQLLRVNIISSDAGLLTGTKYVNLGIRQGQRFTSTPVSQPKEYITK